MEVLNTINKIPTAYANKQTTNINNKDRQYNEQINNNKQQEAKDKEQCTKRADITHKLGAGVPKDNQTVLQGSEVQKTRLGWVVKKLDRLAYV